MSSDSTSSEVTYTSISSHGDPLAWAVDFFRLQEPDSPKAASASPDYVPGPEEPEQFCRNFDFPAGLSVRGNSRRMKNDIIEYEWDAKQGLFGNLKSSCM
ncbi:hypothetical protein Tco_0508651 [Tanacetum coccineum]